MYKKEGNNMSKYLLEVGVEELPYVIIPTFISQLQTSFKNLLASLTEGILSFSTT